VVAWDAIVATGVAFAVLIYTLSLRERTDVIVNCSVYAFSTLVASMAAAVMLTAVESGMLREAGGLILGRVIFASFATAIASATLMSYSYPFPVEKPGRLATYLYGAGIVLAVATLLTPFVIVDARVGPAEGDPTGTQAVLLEFGILALPFSLYAAATHYLILRNEARAWRRAQSVVLRRRARALFFGFIIPGLATFILAGVLVIVMIANARGAGIPARLPVSSFMFIFPLLGVGYSLARYRLFDSELFLRENVVTIVAFFMGGYAVLLGMAVLNFSVPGMPIAVLLVLGLMMFAVVGAGFQFLRGAAAKVIDTIAPRQKWVEFQPVEAYLVKKDSGMLVAHAARGSAKGPDQDIVSSMLSAIQEFVQSSFGSAEPLREMNLGKRRMLIEYGGYLYVAMVYDGRVSEEVREEIRAGLGRLERAHEATLKEWKGKQSEVEPVRKDLREVLEGAWSRAQIIPQGLSGARK
jgi:hypothetical protein